MSDGPGQFPQPSPPGPATYEPDAALGPVRRRRVAILAAALAVVVVAAVAIPLGLQGGGGTPETGDALTGLAASGMVLAPDGSEAYVLGVNPTAAAFGSGGQAADVRIVPVDLTTGKLGTPIDVPGPARGAGGVNGNIALAPDGSTAYVTFPGASTVIPVDLATGRASRAIELGGGLLGGSGSGVCGLAIAPSGSTAYVTGCGSLTTDNVVPISLPSGVPGAPIRIDVSATSGALGDLVIAPGGGTAYITDIESAASAEGAAVIPLSLASGVAGKPIHITGGPVSEADIAIAPGGGTAYVTTLVDATGGQDISITPVDLATGKTAAAIHVGSGGRAVIGDDAYRLTIPPGGTAGYVPFVRYSGGAGAIIPVGLAAGAPGTAVRLGAGVQDVAIAAAPNGTVAYVATTEASGRYVSKVTVLRHAG
jgi:hypothetical protein